MFCNWRSVYATLHCHIPFIFVEKRRLPISKTVQIGNNPPFDLFYWENIVSEYSQTRTYINIWIKIKMPLLKPWIRLTNINWKDSIFPWILMVTDLFKVDFQGPFKNVGENIFFLKRHVGKYCKDFWKL